MPKPVLSDSLFNADDVATAILSEANLQVTNSDLGVVDRSSVFTRNGPTFVDTAHSINAYSFNGFMFINFAVQSPSTPQSGTTIYTINDSNFYPNAVYTGVGLGYQGDLVNYVRILTTGEVQARHPIGVGATDFNITCNMFYRFT